MKRLLMAVFMLVFLPVQAKAEFQVPDAKETAQWKVELLKPSKGNDLIQAEKGKHEVYSVLVSNKGETAYNVDIGAFRSEPGSSKMFGLAPQMNTDTMEKGQSYRVTNFPIETGVEELEFVITWRDAPDTLNDGQRIPGRRYIETFVFFPNDK